ncbi:hypothetical protein TL16_g11483 [Triparma laevis f. inornata]|uniref:Cyclic nucleotide-binding domain-containing protein n=1 Tax=Triparma laevis f. inornata TaxID=1714386 RepID=A0A9W7BKY0_9STRA|nr:hypothetical protein TL16_g11483 [Triparma laevis f. inornata]
MQVPTRVRPQLSSEASVRTQFSLGRIGGKSNAVTSSINLGINGVSNMGDRAFKSVRGLISPKNSNNTNSPGGDRDLSASGGIARKMSIVQAKNVASASVRDVTTRLSQAKKERRQKLEDEEKAKKADEEKKKVDYQNMINKYKFRSVSVSVTDEDNLDFRAKIENTFAERQLAKKFIIHPDTNLLRIWEITIMMLVIWQAIYVPAVLAFEPIIPFGLWVFDKVGDIMFIVDFFMQFNIARKLNGRLPEGRREIARQYVTSSHGMWFLIDLSASFPYDWVTQNMNDVWSYNFYIESMKAAAGGGSLSGGVRIVKILRLPRLLRLLKLFRLLKALNRFEKFQRFLKYSRYGHLLRLFTKVMQIIVLCHYGSCIWFAVGGPSGGGMWFQYECITIANHCDDTYKYNTTESQLGCYESCDYENMTDYEVGQRFWTLYVTSYFAIIAMMTAGENLSPISISEKMISVMFILLGSIVMAIVFGEVAVLISNFYARQSRYQTKMEYLFESMKRMGLPPEIERRVYSYYDYIHDTHGTLNGETTAFIPELSRKLAAEVLMYLRMDMIHKVPFFHNISPEVVQQLVLKLTLQVFLPKEYICVRGEVGDEMFFISDGDCEVTIPYKDMPQAKKDEMMRERLKSKLVKAQTMTKKSNNFLANLATVRRKSGVNDLAASGAKPGEGRQERSFSTGPRGQGRNDMMAKQKKLAASARDLGAPVGGDLESGGGFVSFLRGNAKKSVVAKDMDDEEPHPEREMVLATLHQGQHFGEIALILLTKRTANVRAKGFCELCGLSRDVYNKIVAVYIEDKKAMEDFIMSKYGNSENVQDQYRKEQEKVANAQFDMGEDEEESEEEEERGRGVGLTPKGGGTPTAGRSPKGTRKSLGGMGRDGSARVLKELKEQTGSIADSMTESVKTMNDRVDMMIKLQNSNRQRMDEMRNMVMQLKAEREEEGGDRGGVGGWEGDLMKLWTKWERKV